MPDFISRKLSKRKRSDVSLGLAMFGLCLLMVSVGYTVSADQPSKMLNGKVITLKDSTAIPNVHIINQESARATTSGLEGEFRMVVNAGDSIRFQAVGFITQVIAAGPTRPANEEILIISMEEKIYELPSVDIFPYKSFSEFKYAFLNFKDPEPEFKMELPDVVPEPDLDKMPLGFGGVIPGPITFLYDRFSRRGKALRNYQNVLRQEELASRAARVVNPQVIERLTGMKDRAEINAFLIHCGITDEYVVNTRDTEVYARIIACYETYVADGK
jgi:hypothetical protein